MTPEPVEYSRGELWMFALLSLAFLAGGIWIAVTGGNAWWMPLLVGGLHAVRLLNLLFKRRQRARSVAPS